VDGVWVLDALYDDGADLGGARDCANVEGDCLSGTGDILHLPLCHGWRWMAFRVGCCFLDNLQPNCVMNVQTLS